MTTAIQVQGCTSAKVRQLTRRLSQLYDVEVAHCGLKTTQYSLLTNIARLGPMRPVDLAAAMNMSASTLSRNLQPLASAGLILLGAGADARSLLVQITEAGTAKRREAQRHWKVAQQKLNAQIGIERVAALHALIDDILPLLGVDASCEHDD
jgi:DNA-binding MarR family transcriptional regulator